MEARLIEIIRACSRPDILHEWFLQMEKENHNHKDSKAQIEKGF